jgi:hypothetical protein
MCAEAQHRGDAELRSKPLARSVRYERQTGEVWIELTNGCRLAVPTRLLQGLRDVAPRDLKQVRIMGPGLAIEWPRLDMQFTIAGLLAGVFGTKAWMEEEELLRGGETARVSARKRPPRLNHLPAGRPRKNRVPSRSKSR